MCVFLSLFLPFLALRFAAILVDDGRFKTPLAPLEIADYMFRESPNLLSLFGQQCAESKNLGNDHFFSTFPRENQPEKNTVPQQCAEPKKAWK